MSLLTKILLMIIISVILTMSMVSYWIIGETRKVIHNQIDHLLSNNLVFAESKILESNENIFRTTEIISHHPDLIKALFLQVSLGVNRVLNEMIVIYPFYHYILVVEPDGHIFASSTKDNQGNKTLGEQLLGLNFEENPMVPDLTSGKITIGSPGVDPYHYLIGIEPKLSQWFVAPIKKRGEIIGWIVMSYHWQAEMARLLNQIYNQLKEVENSILEALFIDEHQNIVASFQNITQGQFIPSPDKLWSTKSIPFGQTAFNLIIALDHNQTSQPLVHLTESLLIISVISIIVMIGILALTFRFILLKRLDILQEGAQELEKGNLTHQIPFLGKDEIGNLANAFNHMSHSLEETMSDLQESQETLEMKVEERTLELKQTAKDLKVSESKTRSIVETAPNGFVMIDEQGTIQMFNTAAETMFGYLRSEVIGQNVKILVPEPYHSQHDGYLQRYLKTNEPHIIGAGRELSGLRKDGTEFPMYLAVGEVKLEKESLFTGIVIDITQRKEAEKQLRESEEKLHATLSSIDDLVFSLDKEGIFLEYQQPITAKLYAPPETFVGKSYRDVLPPHLVDLLGSTIETVTNKSSVEQIEYSLEIQGKTYWFTAKISPRQDVDNQNTGVTVVSRDTTDRKEVEKQIQQAKETAEEHARQLNKFAAELEFKNLDLEKARRDAEKANKAKSEFLANMSHEIRTPMNAVIGFSELLSTLITDKKQKNYIESIRTAGKSLLTLINDILDLSKVEAGLLEIQYEATALHLLIQEIEQIFKMKVQEKNLELLVELDPELPVSLMLDEVRLRQALINLVGNSIKFTETGYIKITVRAEYQSDDHSQTEIIIIVEDTGIGIPTDQQQLIFESFRQQDGQSNRKYGGTGLGLSLTKKLIEMMNGQISVESTPDKGSTFSIHLRAVNVSAIASSVNEEGEEFDIESMAFEKSKVLVVDDIESNRYLLKECLNRSGLEVVEAENGQHALILVEQYSPKVILMDIRMPVMDGYEATKILKSDPKTADIPVIALTASISANDTLKLKEFGFEAYLAKPVNLRILFEELSRHIKSDKKILTEKSQSNNKPSELSIEESWEVPPELMERLKNEIWTQWETVKNDSVFDHIEDFGKQLLKLGKDYEIPPLQEFGENLQSQAENFDIEGINATLITYPSLIEQL